MGTAKADTAKADTAKADTAKEDISEEKDNLLPSSACDDFLGIIKAEIEEFFADSEETGDMDKCAGLTELLDPFKEDLMESDSPPCTMEEPNFKEAQKALSALFAKVCGKEKKEDISEEKDDIPPASAY